MSYEVKADGKKFAVTVEDIKKNYVNAQISRLNKSIEGYEREIERWTERRHLQPVITDEKHEKLLKAYTDLIKRAQSKIKELDQA
jgi:uncharacterized protein YhaN